jgi:hypothetical protein
MSQVHINDRTNITGFGDVINYSGDADVNQVSLDLIKSIDDSDGVDDINSYKLELDKLGESLGISFDDDEDALPFSLEDDAGDQSESRSETYGYSEPRSTDIDALYKTIPRDNHHNQYNQYNTESLTHEEKKQSILKSVLGGESDAHFNAVEKEREEDKKSILLEEIDLLMATLEDEGIDVTRVQVVDHNSSIDDITNVHKILRLKNDRNRYCSFAEECILSGSHTLEWLFDGKKTYLGRTPDLTGWSSTVNIKLRRMRYDTSTFVSDIMQDYNLGHGTRILCELVPSLFLYSKMKKSQYTDNLITSDQMNAAFDNIRDNE